MAKSTFQKFKPAYRGTASQKLWEATDNLIQLDGEASKRILNLLAVYLSGAKGKQIWAGITFKLVQRHTVTRIYINDNPVPVFDNYEGYLYRYLFNYFVKDSYTLLEKPDDLSHSLRKMGRYIEPYIRLNLPLGIQSLRLLRIYALTHDYKLDENTARSMCNYRSWKFKQVEMKTRFADEKVGIKLSPEA